MHGSKRRGLETERKHSVTAPAPDPTVSSTVFEVGEYQAGAGDVADSAGIEGDVLESLPAGLEQGHGAFAEGA